MNTEDAKDLSVRVSRTLLQRLTSEASESLEILVRKERYPQPATRKRQFFVVMRKPFRTLRSEDLDCVVDLVRSSDSDRYNIHLNFVIPLWKTGQLFGKREATERIKSARDSLKWLYEALHS